MVDGKEGALPHRAWVKPVSGRKIVFLNRYAYPDHSATSQILSDLAFALSAEGQEVVIVASRQRYADAAACLPACERVAGVRIVRVAGTRFGRRRLAGRALDYLSYCLAAGWALLRLARCGDVVVVKTDPPLLGVVAAPIARLRGAKVVNWLQDVFPEVAQALGVPLAGGASGWVLRGLRDQVMRRADCNVVLGQRMHDRLRERKVGADCIRVIHNWADDAGIVPVRPSENPLRAQWDLADKFVVGYSGNLGRAHDWRTVLAAASALRDRADVCFLFIGDGHGLEQLRRAVSDMRLDNFVFKPYQCRERLALSLGAPDVHWLTLRPELEGLIVPSKLYGVLAAGRPAIFVGNRDGEVGRTLREWNCGLTVEQGDHAGFQSAVESLKASPERMVEMGRQARCALEARFTFAAAKAEWVRLLRDLKT